MGKLQHFMADELSQAMQQVEKEISASIKELGQMIAVDTTFPPGEGYGAFATLMETLLKPYGFIFKRVIVPENLWKVKGGPASGERVNLIAELPGDEPVCSLYFHVDTVCAALGWVRDPFKLEENDGKLYGLGSADMKGAIAAAIAAVRIAKAHGIKLAYRPQFLLCTDEEGGLYPGIRYLAEQNFIAGHLLNFNGSADARIWAGCFGSFNLQVTVNGFAAHAADSARSGRPGVNAIETALPMMQAVHALKPAISQRLSALPVRAGHEPLAAQISITTANGGTCGGQVPDRFVFQVSRRYAPEEDFYSARQEIETAITNSVSEEVQVQFDLVGHLTPTDDPEGEHYPRWVKAMQEGFGYKAEDFQKWAAASASDAGYVQQAGVSQEIILSGLIRPTSNAHGADEHTTCADLIALTKTILCYLSADFAPELNPDL